MVVMALVTTFMTTPLLYWVYPPHLLKKEAKETTVQPPRRRSPTPFSFPLPRRKSLVRFCGWRI